MWFALSAKLLMCKPIFYNYFWLFTCTKLINPDESLQYHVWGNVSLLPDTRRWRFALLGRASIEPQVGRSSDSWWSVWQWKLGSCQAGHLPLATLLGIPSILVAAAAKSKLRLLSLGHTNSGEIQKKIFFGYNFPGKTDQKKWGLKTMVLSSVMSKHQIGYFDFKEVKYFANCNCRYDKVF